MQNFTCFSSASPATALPGAILVILLSLCQHNVYASETTDRAQLGAEDWSPATAEAVQRKAAEKYIETVVSKEGPQAVREAHQRLHQEETGFGLVPHAPPDAALERQKATRLKVAEMQRKAQFLAEVEGLTMEQAMSRLNKAPPSPAATSMVLRAPSQGVVTGGGYIQVFDASTDDYLGYSPIGPGGQVSLPVEPGQLVDIVASVYPPFAFQAVRDVTAAEAGDLMMQDSVEVALTFTDASEQVLTEVATDIRLTLRSHPSEVSWQVGAIQGTGTIYLAPGEVYDLWAEPEIPFFAKLASSINTASDPLVIELEEGHELVIEFEDPLHLRGQDGCLTGAFLSVYRSQDVIRGQGQQLPNPVPIYDPESQLAGFITAVPRSAAVDFDLWFYDSPGWCQIEDYRSRLEWFSGNQTKTITLKPRPLPNVIFQEPDGTPIPFSYARFAELDSWGGIYGPEQLIAGRSYAVSVQAEGDYGVSETIVEAQPGPFDVVLQSRPLHVVHSRVTVGGSSVRTALIELYLDGELIEAYETQGNQVTMEIPAGEYDVRLSGVTTQYSDPDTGEYFAVFLQPKWESRTVAGVADEHMDFDLTLPVTGIMTNMPYTEGSSMVTILDSGVPVGTSNFYSAYDGILTDLVDFELMIRGPGYPDRIVPATASELFPLVDLAPHQGPVGRLQGTVTLESGDPLVGARIWLYAEDGVDTLWTGTTDPSGQYDAPKVKNGLFVFQAPGGGESLMHFQAVENESEVETLDVSLSELPFNEVSAEGDPLQLLYGTGERGYRVVFVAEAYTDLHETITDANGNGVWDGAVFIDLNTNGVWDPSNSEPVRSYGERVIDWETEAGTDLTAGNEAFTDLNSDGYPNIDDFAVFVENSRDYIRALLGTPAIAQNIEFDAYILFLPSAQAGVDVYDTDGVKIIDKDTLFGGGWMRYRSLLTVDYAAVVATIESYLPSYDLRVVMLNQPVPVGRANSFILANGGIGVTSPNSLVAGHEFGHNPGRLSDEYNEFYGTYRYYIAPSVGHVTNRKDPATVPWSSHIPARGDVPIAVPNSPGNGVYAGAMYNAGGAYRSTSNSRMRYNAPLYNDASYDVFSRSLCLRSLTDADFIGVVTPPDGPDDRIFSSGFEPESGRIEGLCE